MACVSALLKTGIPVGTPVQSKVGDLIVEDYNIRNYLKKTLYSAGVPTIEIERDSNKVRIYIHCSRPGVVIGKGGAEIERIRLSVAKDDRQARSISSLRSAPPIPMLSS